MEVMEFRVAMKQGPGGFTGVPFPSLVSRHSSWRCEIPKLSEPPVTLTPVRSGPEYEKHHKKKNENPTQKHWMFGFSAG